MVRENQITVILDEDIFTCNACNDRAFTSYNALLQHCRTAKLHRGEWCERCDWLFVSSDALHARLRDSRNHWICKKCTFDGDEAQALKSHMARDHNYCYDCEVEFSAYREHRIHYHNRCKECEREFDTQNNLLMHMQVHKARSEECFGCYRKFKSVSGILLHLDRDGCESGITEDDINSWAFTFPQQHLYTNDWEEDYKYHCPACDCDFSELSGLYQHIESRDCGESYKGMFGCLKGYLKNKALNALRNN